MKIFKSSFLAGDRGASTIFCISFLVVILDQAVKYLISRYMGLHQSIPLIPNMLHLTYIRNTGAGFGILKGRNISLIFISIAVISIILFYLKKIIAEKQINIPVALVLGGAVGNLIDRIFIGHVIDFIDFRVWPAFNIADSAITIGAVWLMIYFWKK
ncbi:signal peptidase II, partial [Candidatus Woesearchaeota archaeon]|nr:signal peptidase II [Candidatus Woesearchaeota archaeon]